MFQSPHLSPPALRSATTRPVESPVTTNQHCMGACVQGVEKQQDTRSACTIIGALHTHIVCGVASALACGVGAHLCQSVQILCVPVPGPMNSLNCDTHTHRHRHKQTLPCPSRAMSCPTPTESCRPALPCNALLCGALPGLPLPRAVTSQAYAPYLALPYPMALSTLPRHASSVWRGNWFSVGIGPLSKATQ